MDSLDHQDANIRRNRSGKHIHYVAVVLTERGERHSGIVKSLVVKLDETHKLTEQGKEGEGEK
jgi:hypothetical protein